MKCGTKEACNGCEVLLPEVSPTTRATMGIAAEGIGFVSVAFETAFGEDSPEIQEETDSILHCLWLCPDMTEDTVEQVRLAANRIKAGNCK